MRDLKELRAALDEIDQRIVELYEERMRTAEEVAHFKIGQHLTVLDRAREREKLQAVGDLAKSDFTRRGATELFEQLMTMSRVRQYQMLAQQGVKESMPLREVEDLFFPGMKVVYQGTEGAFADMAQRRFFQHADAAVYNVDSWRDAMREIVSGRADYAVLPFENSSAGIVSENYDLLVEYDTAIVGELILPVEHCLLAVPGAKLSDITEVYSHAQALMQCSRFLDKNRQIRRVGVPNTAFAAKKIAEEQDIHHAAIASEMTAELYKLQFLKHGIQNNENNSTRFLIVSHDRKYIKGASKVTVCFELPHESGSLYHELSHFIYNGLNMNHIESRPVPGKNWEYRFFIDFDGNLNEERVKNALLGLQEETMNFRILGNY